jgi:hypothetical protein
MFPLPANIYFEIAAFLTGVIFWYKIKRPRLRLLVPFLFFIVVVEFLGRHISKDLHQSNAWLYNISIPVEYLFYAFLFSNFYKRKFSKSLVKLFLVVFPIWVLINLFFVQGFFEFNTNFLKVGSFCMILLCFLVFVELLMGEELINPFTQPLFWIACGLFLFNAGEFTYNTFSDLMMRKWQYGKNLFEQINNNLIFVLYTCIIIAIISSLWAPKEKT